MLVELYQLYTLHIVKSSDESIEHSCVKKPSHNFNIPGPKEKKRIVEYNRRREKKHALSALSDSMFQADVLMWSSVELARGGAG